MFIFSESNIERIVVIKRMKKLSDGSTFYYLSDKNNKNFTVLGSKVIAIGDVNSLCLT